VIRLAVRVRREDAELVLAELLELAPAGVEEVDVDGETIEYAVYGASGELAALPDVRAAAGAAFVEVHTTELPDDWSERWKRFHRPVLLEPPRLDSARRTVPALHVRPPWEAASERGEVEEIVIDPGQAFGTGAHATTRMCLELLLELAAGEECPRGPLVDVGTGSGVLAIAGARLGYAPVLALDHDPGSVAAAAENAGVNDVSIDVSRLDLRREPLPSAACDGVSTVLANLLRPLLLDLARSMERAPRHLIASGLLVEQVDEVVGAFGERLGLRERERRTSGEWAAVWLASAQTGSATSVAARAIAR
jgi:ribosomal protein L11 methyltransferase